MPQHSFIRGTLAIMAGIVLCFALPLAGAAIAHASPVPPACQRADVRPTLAPIPAPSHTSLCDPALQGWAADGSVFWDIQHGAAVRANYLYVGASDIALGS